MTPRWTTSADLVAKVRRRWDDGSLLRALAADAPFPAVDVPVRGPQPGEIGDDLAAVRRWVASLESDSRDGRRYEVVHGAIGGRHFGRNQIPARLRVTTYDQAWQLLGTAGRVAAFRSALDAASTVPAVRTWVADHPMQALEYAGQWQQLVSAFVWLDRSRGSGQYLRAITAPGVDTKFVERHRAVLSKLLDVPANASGFGSSLGLGTRPEVVRLRFDPGFMGLPDELSEGTFRLGELTRVRVAVAEAVIVENELTFLTVPVPAEGVVLWGKGFDVNRAGALPWLRDARVHYWGDLDTHGFAILDRLRAQLPRARSLLMDRETLVQHRERWVREPSPTSAHLPRLDEAEAALYAQLVTDALGDSVRLEQERIDWTWVEDHLPYH